MKWCGGVAIAVFLIVDSSIEETLTFRETNLETHWTPLPTSLHEQAPSLDDALLSTARCPGCPTKTPI